MGVLVERFFDLAQGGAVDVADDAVVDVTEALRMELGVLDRWREHGETLGGWKIGFTAGPSRSILDGDRRPFGYVLASRVLASGSSLDLAAIGSCALEPEICVRIATPLAGPSVTPDEARAAVGAIVPSFEVNDVRLRGRPLPLVIADNLAQWGIVVGDELPPEGLDLLATSVEVSVDGETIARSSAGGFLDDPYVSLARVCAALDEFGLGLEPGQRVITGGFSNHAVTGPGEWRAAFDTIGAVAVRLTRSHPPEPDRRPT